MGWGDQNNGHLKDRLCGQTTIGPGGGLPDRTLEKSQCGWKERASQRVVQNKHEREPIFVDRPVLIICSAQASLNKNAGLGSPVMPIGKWFSFWKWMPWDFLIYPAFPFFLLLLFLSPFYRDRYLLIEVCLGNGSIRSYHLIIVWLWISHLIKLSLIVLINKGNNNSPNRTVERNTVCEAFITEFGSICGNQHCGLLCPLTGRRHWGLSGKQVKIPDLMKLS